MPKIYQFGVFEVNRAAGELRKHGVRVKLHAQPFQVLGMLLERAGEVVTRQEMREPRRRRVEVRLGQGAW